MSEHPQTVDRFALGDRVIDPHYGPGTIEYVRDGIVGVVALGQIWFRDPADVRFLDEDEAD